MDVVDHGLVLLAAFVAGAVNAVAGGGSLLTFPVLLAVGFDPVPASITNTLGLMPGYLGGAHAYREEIRSQRERVRALVVPAGLGAIAGAALLLQQPRVGVRGRRAVPRAARRRHARPPAARVRRGWPARPRRAEGLPPLLLVVTFIGGVYGAYFGGALGVILLAALGSVLADDLQRINGLKSLLSLVVNGVAAAIFVFSPQAHWTAVAAMAVGSLAGGRLGAGVARRLGATQLRLVVVTVALTVAIALFAT